MLLNKLTNKITKIVEFPFLVLSMQIKQNECQKLKDNILLAKLKYKAPKCYDRDFEYPWMIRNIDLEEGKLLDVGSTIGEMLRDLLSEDVNVYTLNYNKQENVKGISQVQGDIRDTKFEDNTFDYITCISTLEHIGVGGRYGVKEDPKGDIKAMREMHRILKPRGKLLLTIPYGAEDVLPINKLYSKNRTKELFKEYKLISGEYLKYNKEYNLWFNVKEEEATETIWQRDRWYSIGLFVLRK